MTQYTYGFLIGLTLGASIATTVALWHTRRWIERIRTDVGMLQTAGLQGGRALHALVTRLSPNGHVDISEEEWQAQEDGACELKLIDYEGGVRILVK